MPDALRFTDVHLSRDGTSVLRSVDWTVQTGERWVVLGPNGSGKTSLISLASGYLHPTSGTVEVLGARLGRVDVRQLRRRIGLTSAALAKLLRPGVAAVDVVMTGRSAALETWWEEWSDHDRSRAHDLLAAAGLAHAVDRPFGVLSEGERQQVQLARALMADPELLLLDEPAAGLDLGARERLVGRLADLAAAPAVPPIVFVTHHVEEIPPGFTSALLLRDGRIVAAGPLDEVLTAEALSACFGLVLDLDRRDGRFASRARRPS